MQILGCYKTFYTVFNTWDLGNSETKLSLRLILLHPYFGLNIKNVDLQDFSMTNTDEKQKKSFENGAREKCMPTN